MKKTAFARALLLVFLSIFCFFGVSSGVAAEAEEESSSIQDVTYQSGEDEEEYGDGEDAEDEGSGDIAGDPLAGVPEQVTDPCQVYDNASFFSDSEKAQVLEGFQKIYDEYGVSVYMLATTALGKNDNYSAAVGELRSRIKASEVVILFFAHKEAGNRRTQIYSYGECEERLTSGRLHEAEENVASYAKNGNMTGALNSFTKDIDHFLGRAPILDSLVMQWYVHLIFAALIGALVVYINWPKGGQESVSVMARTYLDAKNSRVIGAIDRYTYTTTQVIHHDHDSDSGGGGGGGGGTTGGGADY